LGCLIRWGEVRGRRRERKWEGRLQRERVGRESRGSVKGSASVLKEEWK